MFDTYEVEGFGNPHRLYPYTMSWELYGDEKKINYMPEIDILRIPHKIFGCPLGMPFKGLSVQI